MSDFNYTTSSVEEERIDDEDLFNEIATYYNQIIHNNKSYKPPTKRYQELLDKSRASEHLAKVPSPETHNKNIIIKNNDKSNTGRKPVMKNCPRPIHISRNNLSDSDYGSCSKNIPINDTELRNIHQNTDQIVGPSYAEKTTYCRPTIDVCNQDFIFKTMQRNARLQGLVRRIVLAREKEKQKVAWNNYINELKSKHRYDNSEPRIISHYTPDNTYPKTIEDYYNTKFTWQQSNPCQNLLQDFYSASNEMNPDINQASHVNRRNESPYTYENSRYCYPTSSQARIMFKQERERYGLVNQSQPIPRYKRIPIFVDREAINVSSSKRNLKRESFNFKYQNFVKNMSAQTDFNIFEETIDNKLGTTKETFKEKYNRVSCNVQKLKENITRTQNEVKSCSLLTIENKLDSLIQSVNTFIFEMKNQKSPMRKEVTCQLSDDKLINTTKSDTFGLLRRESFVCGMVQEKPRSKEVKEGKRCDTINDILYEEMRKSNRVKKDIEEIISKSSHERPSVHITLIDIPTKERATEITDSLYKTGHSNVVVEEVDGHSNRMTIAVNTDPLGLLALFRVSAETVKQMLSYMPQIDCSGYLSRLSLPTSRNEISSYVCNICGASFIRPSQLSEHIQQHNLGNSRDCCVCRHVLDMQRHRAGLFSCRHCGQRFTRAYCRELHEQDCARSLGLPPDHPESLMMLS